MKRSLSLWLQDKSCLLQPKKLQSEMVWYFIGLYIINRTLHSYLEMQNVSSCVQNIFFNNQREISNVSVINIFFYRPKVDVSTLRPPDTIIAQPRRLIHPYALISGHPEWWTLGSPTHFHNNNHKSPHPRTLILHKNITPKGQQLLHMKPQVTKCSTCISVIEKVPANNFERTFSSAKKYGCK